MLFAQNARSWDTLVNLAEQREAADDLAGSEALCREALESAERQLGTEHPQIVPLSTQLAAILHGEGRDADAEPMLRHALAIANLVGDQKLLGIALNGLGNALLGEGETARAEPVLRRSLAMFQQAEGTDALDTAKAANNLATVYCDSGQYEQAEKEMGVALTFYERHPSSYPVLFAMTLRNMFVVLLQQHRAVEAESYLVRALDIGNSSFPNSRKMADLRFAQAVFNARRGKWQEAASLLRQVIEVQERLLGARHPLLAHSLLTYSEVLRRLHQRGEARRAQLRGTLILKSLQVK